MTSKQTELPAYRFRADMPSLWDMATKGVSDFASVVPAAILDRPAIQLPSPPIGPAGPLVIADPGLAREVLLDREGRFGRDVLMKRLMRRSWGRGLAAAEGEPWARQRKAVAPLFRAGRVAQHESDFAAAANAVMAEWGDEESLDVSYTAARMVARVVFSALIAPKTDVDVDRIARDMPAYIGRIAGFGGLDLLPLPETVHDRLRGMTRDPAVARMRVAAQNIAGSVAADDDPDRDFATMVASAGPVEDNVRGLFPAAMDTTVQGLSWSLIALASQPEWQNRAAAEAMACAGTYTVDRLPVTRRVVEEALRLFPPAPMLVRSAKEATHLGGHEIRKGQTVAVCIYAMHRHRTLWIGPDRFDPDRFAGSGVDRTAYMPFGYGPRVCVASQFALAEMVVIVATILAERSIELSGSMPPIGLQVATRPLSPVTIRARRH